ncbi:MAG: DUF4105 domain-containing protein [Planctomycetota bacterium]
MSDQSRTQLSDERPATESARSIRAKIVSIGANLFRWSIWAIVLVFAVWALGATWWLPFFPAWLQIFATLSLAVWYGWLIWHALTDVNPLVHRALIAATACFILLVTLLAQPSLDRDWAADQSRLPDVSIVDDVVEIGNYRHSQYRSESDFDVRWSTKSFELDRIQRVWFLVQRFAPTDGLAHVFLSFELASTNQQPADYICLSIEIRREVGESYGPIKGLYRVYEIIHVFGDERDLIGVRTVHRPNDRVYLFPLNATPSQAQQLFQRFADRTSKLAKSPEFYHTLLNNCANGLTRQTYQMTQQPINWLDPRIVLPGFSAQFAHELQLIGEPQSDETFELLEQRCRIDQHARVIGITASFSQDIRAHMKFQRQPDTDLPR